MREYAKDRPFLIVGETADDYLGEYMAGGVVMVLNLSELQEAREELHRDRDGRRQDVHQGQGGEEQVGLIPQREDVLRYLHSQTLDGTLPKEAYEQIAGRNIPSVQLLSKTLPEALMIEGPDPLLLHQVHETSHVETQETRAHEDLSMIGPKLKEFFKAFALPTRRWQKCSPPSSP